MNANVGGIDRAVRLVLGIVLMSLYFVLAGNARWIAAAGVVLFVTGLVRWCPAYLPFGFNTCRK